MPLPRKVALVVDDDILVRSDIKKVLKAFDFDTIEAVNGREGVEKFKKQKFDLVTMDFMMPELNGVQTANEIRRLDKNILIIGLSSSHRRMEAECKKLGLVIPVLSKFEMPDVLINFIRGLCDERSSARTISGSEKNT